MTSTLPPPSFERKSSEIGFDLCETLWKRRNGLGKHADQNWVPRCFTFHGSILCYYDEEHFDDAGELVAAFVVF